jgi:lysophospholipase L1-like esterase
MRFSRLFYFVVCWIVLSCSAPAHALDILTFGDSITKGWPYIPNDPYGKRVGVWQPMLEQLLYDYGIRSYVYNWGVGGETTPEGVNRIATVLASRSADYILIMEGTNDVLNGISSSTTQYDIGVMIDRSLGRGVTPILGTIPPNFYQGKTSYNDLVEGVYNPKLLDIASLKHVRVADQYTVLRPEWLTYPLHSGDYLHPNIEGYSRIANTWYGAIVPQAPVGAIMLLLLK